MSRIGGFAKILALAGAAASAGAAQPVIFTVLNGASSSAVLAPGAWVSIYGFNFAAAPQTAQSATLPITLGGVSVTVGGQPASLRYVSPSQVNALIPLGVAIPTGTVVPLVVTSSGGTGSYSIRLTRDAPAIFSQDGSGFGLALVFDAKLNPVATVHPTDLVILYAAGLGPVDSSGKVMDPVDVYLGERKAQVLFAGLAPGFPGVYQLNVIAPALATDRIYLRSGGWQSNIVYMSIQAGANTKNVMGGIDGLYPSSNLYPLVPCYGSIAFAIPCGSESFSIMLHAGTFSASFDIAPNAAPFDVAAVSEAGSAIISINPAGGTYTASITTLTPAARAGDFSQSSFSPVWDYGSCEPAAAVCSPFPASIIPITRISPLWAKATQVLPMPNMPGTEPNALFQTSGSLSGSHFTISAQNNSGLSNFGGIVQVPYGPFNLLGSTFTLYVDGAAITATSLPYLPATRCVPIGPFCWSAPGPVVYPPELEIENGC